MRPGSFLLWEAVAFAPDIQDVVVVEEAVEDAGGHNAVARHLVPFGEPLLLVRMMLPRS
ncbi:MAG TPA: hypothetical protein VG815_21775 [Chloroflexota bacterium]|jgi:hypothetical protein|nr:hypothetical protein [Chloroflexota bacterium]